MKILAIDFSSPRRGVALAETRGNDVDVLARAEERAGQATHAFAMIGLVLQQAGIARDAIEGLVIGLGPGSYAGIRVSLAIAQGWQLATSIKTLGIGSVECLAATAWSTGQRGHAAFAVDAQRGEFYLAEYELDAAGAKEIAPLRIVGPAEIARRLAAGIRVFGPEVATAFPGAHELYPDAGVLAGLGLRRGTFVPAEELEPVYLREASFVKAPPARRL